MLDEAEAYTLIKKALPDVTIKARTKFKEVFLFRVEWPSEAEMDWDPFVSVDSITGEVRDFSILTDGDISEIDKLTWNEVLDEGTS